MKARMQDNLIKKLSILIAIAIFITVIFVSSVFADIVKLKSGREISGRLKEITDKDVVLEIGGGTIWFAVDQVESINNLSVEEARARISTTEAFVMRDKNEAISSSAKEGLNFISKTRKLEFKNIPEIEVTDKEKLRQNIKALIDKHYGEEKLDTDAKLLVKLGLISKAEDYKREVLELFVEEVYGYYNPDDKKIFITEKVLREILPGVPSMTIMHEQVHALQDQYHDLTGIEEKITSGDDDRGLAIQSVIEGEATVLMYDAFLRSMKGFGLASKEVDIRSFVIDSMLAYSKRLKTAQDKPAVFMEGLFFPYVWGGSFIQYTVNTKGWEALDTIYNDLPVSSEQIMHPEKYYIIRDEPKEVKPVDLTAVLGDSWKKLTQDVLGEFSFYLIGKNFLDELTCKMMSEGWGGDYFALYEELNTKQLLFISLSKWDSERDADEFFSFYKKVIEKKYKQLTLTKEAPNSCQYKTEDQNVYIAKSKDSVIIIEGAPDDLLPSLISAFAI
jgi:hypothetical protein